MKTFLLIGVGPFLGGLMLLGIFVKSCVDLSKPENGESATCCSGWGRRSSSASGSCSWASS